MNDNRTLVEMFKDLNTSDFPDFYSFKKPLERGLWVLLVSKDKLERKKLTAEQIASVIRDVKEISIDATSITKSFNRAGDKIHTYQEGEETSYEIMRPGKDHIISQVKEGTLKVFYFEPGKPHTSRRQLAKNVLANLKGTLRVVDPYCGERTLDIFSDVKNRTIKFLTRIENLRDRDRSRFLRALQDFKTENPNIEFRNYPNTDIHDRYIISSELLAILGHSIKNLGGKESFAIVFNKNSSKDIVEALIENFNRRWKKSKQL